jgi:hypothetical protein
MDRLPYAMLAELLEYCTVQDILQLRQCSKMHKVKIDIAMEPLCRGIERTLKDLPVIYSGELGVSAHISDSLTASCRGILDAAVRTEEWRYLEGLIPPLKNLICLVATLSIGCENQIRTWQQSREDFVGGVVFRKLRGFISNHVRQLNFIRLATCINRECYRHIQTTQDLPWRNVYEQLHGFLRHYITVCQVVQNKVTDYATFARRQELLLKLFVCQEIIELVQSAEFRSLKP